MIPLEEGEWGLPPHTWHWHFIWSINPGCDGVVYGLPVWRRPFPCDYDSLSSFLFLFFYFFSCIICRGEKGPWGGNLLFFFGFLSGLIGVCILYCCLRSSEDNQLGGMGDLVQSATTCSFLLASSLPRVSLSLFTLWHNMKKRHEMFSIIHLHTPTLSSTVSTFLKRPINR